MDTSVQKTQVSILFFSGFSYTIDLEVSQRVPFTVFLSVCYQLLLPHVGSARLVFNRFSGKCLLKQNEEKTKKSVYIYIYINIYGYGYMYICLWIYIYLFRAPSVDHREGVPARTRFSGAAFVFYIALIGDWRLGEKVGK